MPHPVKKNLASVEAAFKSIKTKERVNPEAAMAELLTLGAVAEGVLTIDSDKFETWREKYTAPITAKPVVKFTGAGDVAAAMFQPVAKAFDAILGTDIQNCSGCAERKEILNNAIPFTKKDDVK